MIHHAITGPQGLWCLRWLGCAEMRGGPLRSSARSQRTQRLSARADGSNHHVGSRDKADAPGTQNSQYAGVRSDLADGSWPRVIGVRFVCP